MCESVREYAEMHRFVESFKHTCKTNSPEHLQQRLVHEPVDILGMVVCLVGSLGLLLGLTGVDALENAQAPVFRGADVVAHAHSFRAKCVSVPNGEGVPACELLRCSGKAT